MKKTYLTVIMMLVSLLSQTAESATVNVNLNDANQTIRGFGGMNFPRWIGTLTNAQVDKAFGNGSGQIGLTIMRIDVPFDSGSWSGQVAAAQRAINNHGAIVFASPWSPPASMKTNGNTTGGELKTDSYGAYATHLSDFADYMSDNNAPLYAISLQNEPDISVTYESCDWTSTQMINFLINNASVIPTRVMAAESYQFFHSFTDPILNDPSAEAQVDIIAGHIYGGGLADYPLARSKGKEVWMTEHYTDSTTNANVWPNALNVGKEIHDCMAANMNAYIWWYIRRSYGPLDESGNITKRGYCMSHFAKFVRPEYIRVDATARPSSGVYVTAYKSDSNLVIVAINQNSSSSDVTFSLSGGIVSSYTKYQTASDSNLSNMGSVGSTNTLVANSINTFVGTIVFEDDNTPPTPDPMTWASEPTATGSSSIEMTAATATDISGVEYYFDCLTAGGHDSGWQNDTYYEDTGLDPDTQYSYRVQARDKNPAQNVTDWSSTLSATTWSPDTTPPSPNPMTWATAPTATGSSTITMTASTATDSESPPVQYYFECTNDASKSSAWQASPTYLAGGLTPNTMYSFRVKARDSYTTPNETGYSGIASATTLMPSTDVNIVGSWVTGTTHAKENGSDRALLFIVFAEKASTITLNSVTYGGQTMTKVIDRTAGTTTHAYTAAYILNEAGIAAATTTVFTPNWSATPGEVSYESVFLSNVNQTTLIGDSNSNGTASSTPNPITTAPLSTNDGDIVILGATCGNTSNYTVNNGFTEAIENDMASSTGTAGYKFATGVTETPSVTNSSVNRQTIIGFVIKAVAGVINNPPAAPANLTAIADNGTVSLDWNDNNETDLAGYDVFRSTTSGSGYSKINASIVTESNYVDSGVSNGSPYFYVVTAVDDANNESGYSNEVTVTPNYQNCSQVQAGGDDLKSDLNGDCYVDWQDLKIVADYWLNTDCGSYNNCDSADMDYDGIVTFLDLNNFAEQWMQCNDPENLDCVHNW